jgi:hypothetical protein
VTITWRMRALHDMQQIQAFVTAGSSAAWGNETLVALHEQINDLLVNPINRVRLRLLADSRTERYAS